MPKLAYVKKKLEKEGYAPRPGHCCHIYQRWEDVKGLGRADIGFMPQADGKTVANYFNVHDIIMAGYRISPTVVGINRALKFSKGF